LYGEVKSKHQAFQKGVHKPMKHLNFAVKALVGMVLITLLVGIGAGPAAASSPPVKRDYNGLKYALELALIRVDILQDQIDYIRRAADVAEEFIQDEQADGHDTSELEIALGELQDKAGEAQALHDEAVQILDEKAGFDENGEVVDQQLARNTLQESHRTMQDANQTLRRARQDFRQAMRDYRQSKRD
jgi:hypothetical protein